MSYAITCGLVSSGNFFWDAISSRPDLGKGHVPATTHVPVKLIEQMRKITLCVQYLETLIACAVPSLYQILLHTELGHSVTIMH